MRHVSFQRHRRGITQKWVSLLVLAFVCSLGTSMFWHDNRERHKRARDAEPPSIDALPPALREANLKARKGPFAGAQNANAFRLVDIYGKGKTGSFPEDTLVLCDTFSRRRPGGQRTGMPVLFYRADSSRYMHDVDNPDNPQNIYSYKDNQALVSLGVPGDPDAVHPLAAPRRFYLNTQSDRITTVSRPFRSDQYILISAGRDGLYGTADDIGNFEWRYRER